MKTSDFNYYLPQELIAQTPIEPRDASRLLCLDRNSGQIEHKHFRDLPVLLQPGDLLVMNDSRVMPSRLIGEKEGTGGAMEFLLLSQKDNDTWETMVRPGKKAKPGSRFIFGEGLLRAEVQDISEDGTRIVKFEYDGNNIYDILDRVGNMPLPPYITEQLKDKERYQTVYAKELGSAAAPTAGLHFTSELIEKLNEIGVDTAYVTLHVGLGTFRPVKEDNITDHHMHTERYSIPNITAEKVNSAKRDGRRVISVGTTSCRTLESAYDGELKPCEFTDTSIFIYPGYEFKCIDGLITNFHLPESTLIMLVSAFADRERVLNAYRIAVEEKYRFFSFGDAMLIL